MKSASIDWKPKNSDLLLLLFVPIYIALIYRTHLPLSFVLLKSFALRGVNIIALLYALSVVVILAKALWLASQLGVGALKAKAVWRELSKPYFTWSFLLISVKRAAVILGAIYVFLHLKHLILWLNTKNYDQFFWDLDRLIHFGVQPNIIAVRLLRDFPTAQVALDWLYIKYFDYKLLVSVLFLLEFRSRRLSDSFFTAYAFLWLSGGLAYLAFPADGPCYAMLSQHSVGADPKARAHIFQFPLKLDQPSDYLQGYAEAKIPTAKQFQQTLWQDRQNFLAGRTYPGAFYGIAAMPSLHVAAVTMITLLLFHLSKVAGVLSLLFACATFIGSIYLQWHYAVDGYVGFLLGFAAALIGLHVPRLIGERSEDQVSQFSRLAEFCRKRKAEAFQGSEVSSDGLPAGPSLG